MVILRRLGATVGAATLVAITALSLNRVYSGWLLAGLVAGAALAAALVSLLLRRAPAGVVAPVSVAAMAGYALGAVGVCARSAGLSGDLPAVTGDAARNAVPRLLTALIPVEPQPDTVLAPVVLAWVAAFAATELAVRAGRPAAALVPPTVLYAVVLALVGPNAPAATWQALSFAAVAALCLVLGAPATTPAGAFRPALPSRERILLRVRTAGGLGVGLAAVLGVAVVVSSWVAGGVRGSPGDPRSFVQPPSLAVMEENPLIRVAGWAAFPEETLFRVEMPGSSPPVVVAPVAAPESPAPAEQGTHDTRLRLAVLPDWDGVTWHSDGDYRSAGRVLPPAAPPPGSPVGRSNPARTIEQRITVEGLRGRLLPAIAAPARVEGIRVAYDPASGTLLNNEPLAPGLTYTVTSVSPTIDVAMLPGSDVPHGEEVARYLAVGPAVPGDLSLFAQSIAAGQASPYQRAFALQTFMREHYTLSADAPSGHAYPNLRFFLLADRAAGGQRGTSEQFAAGFAALGRLLGLPTRVVVGFRVPAGDGVVTAADAVAWPEVLFTGVGWVPFDPLPLPGTQARPVERDLLPPPPPTTQIPQSQVPPPVTPTAAPSTGKLAGAAPQRRPDAGALAASAAAGAVGVVLLALIVVMMARAVRTRRRLATTDPARLVIGAWGEVVDGLVLAGRPAPAHLTAAGVADHAAGVIARIPGRHERRVRPAAPDLRRLARTVNAVAFGGGTVAEPDAFVADIARSDALAFRRALYARHPWWRRLLWRVDPRPLRRPR